MNKITDFFNQNLDENSDLVWPQEHEERAAFARKLFGLGFVSAHDSWLKAGSEILAGVQRQTRVLYVGESEARQHLASLSPEQRHAVEWLLKYTVAGAIFSSFVSLDQFPRAEVQVVVRPVDDNLEPMESFGAGIPVAPAMTDLHDDWSGWLEEFSEYGSQKIAR